MLTYRQSKPAVSRNPLVHVLQSDSITSTARKIRVMSPQQDSDDSAIPTAASKWTKKTLNLLNAKYESRLISDLIFDQLELPDELQKGTTRFIKSAKYSRRSGSR